MIEMDPIAMKEVIKREIGLKVIGRSVWEIESFMDDFFYYVDIQSLYGVGEIARWDALGKHIGIPLHQLLGGKCTETVLFTYCVGIQDPEATR